MAHAQMVALTRQARLSNFVPPVNSIILGFLLWGNVPTIALVVWVGIVWATSAVRWQLYRHYDTAVARGAGYGAKWRIIWIGVHLAAGMAWGIGSAVLFTQDSFLIQAYLVIFVLGMGAGATASFAPFFPALVAYLVPLTVPIAGILVIQENTESTVLGVSGVVFLLALVFLGRAANRNFSESFRLGVENETLTRGLKLTQDRLEGALDSMSDAFGLFDANDNLIEHNNKFRRLVHGAAVDEPRSMSYAQFLRALAVNGRVVDADQHPDEWVGDIQRLRGLGSMPVEIAMVDGTWLQLDDAPTDDGGTVTTLSDISDMKRQQVELSDSEQRFRDFTSAASDWVWELDSETRFTHVSGRFSEVSGRLGDYLIGHKIGEKPSEGSKEEWSRLIAAIAARQPFRNVRVKRPHGNGGDYHFLVNGRPIFGPSGQFLGYRGTGTDITAMVLAEDRAREAQSRLFDAIESIPAGFVLFDEMGRLILWNSRAPEYFPGASSRIVAGSTFEHLMRGSAENGAIAEVGEHSEAWVTSQAAWFENPRERREMRFSDGRHVQLLGRGTTDGGTVCVMTDITDIRLGQEELAEKTTLLQATLEGMGEGLIVLDGHLRAVLTNTRLDRLAVFGGDQDLLGAPFREILGSIGADIEHIADAPGNPEPDKSLDERLADGLPFQFEITRTGRQIMLVRADPLPHGGWVCVFTDITAERRAVAALEESEDRYRRLIEASPDMIAIQAQGRIVFANAAGAHLLGAASPAELIGRRALDFVHPDNHDSVRASKPMSGFHSDIEIHEFRGRRIDGTTFEGEATGIEFAYQGAPAVLVIIRDISDRKLAQAQLIQTSKLALLGEMAASMAHELNQPLNIIRMAADASLILMEENKADMVSHREEFDRISNQSERMADIINHMRVFSRQEDETEDRFNPIACVDSAASMVREQYRLDGVEVRTILPKVAPYVFGQPIRLEQVVLNLLANARDAVFSQKDMLVDGAGDRSRIEGGVIEVSAFVAGLDDDPAGRARPEEVVISVSDNGGGISEENLEQVFEPFFTTKRAGKGTGLGLAIGYSIISGMGGTISVANGPKGAVFEIRLPIAQPDSGVAHDTAADG
ncbi:MAG: PAS-domain containing protein [Alphaproteobacteria bacterium]